MPIVMAEDPAPGLKVLLEAYPKAFKLGEDDTLIWPDGSKTSYRGEARPEGFSHDKLLDVASLEEQMQQRYPVGAASYAPPPRNFEPGRLRHEPFFRKMYGNSAEEVRKTLRTITWLPNIAPQKLSVTTVNGVDRKLEAVSAEIEKLPAELRKFAAPSAGTFSWRVIAGTNRLSTHSFATSIDLNVKKSNYWKWDKSMTYRNQIPHEIVEIFEKHGFVWGGKWYHYDTMHFEYRPELLLRAKKGAPGATEQVVRGGE
jgi:peptidoglycan L-alanyl-D-glutamate endopeptidase CwlK